MKPTLPAIGNVAIGNVAIEAGIVSLAYAGILCSSGAQARDYTGVTSTMLERVALRRVYFADVSLESRTAVNEVPVRPLSTRARDC